MLILNSSQSPAVTLHPKKWAVSRDRFPAVREHTFDIRLSTFDFRSRKPNGFRDTLRSVLASPPRYEARLHAGLAAGGDDEEVGRLLDDREVLLVVSGLERSRDGVAVLQLGERGGRVLEDVLLDLLAAEAG